MRFQNTIRLIVLSFGLLGITACNTVSYYSQSISGHLGIWWSAKPIDEILQEKTVDEKTEKKLRTALEIREFASRELLLPKNESYRYYVDVGRPSVVWNIFAAPEFSVDAYRWCYLIIGCVGYRGYYDEQRAHLEAAKMAEQKYDVYISGVSAYSTLGWFSDPLLNTMIDWNDRAIASLIFHELSHQVIYISGDSDFNEAFATSVEQIGTIYWLEVYEPQKLNDFIEIIHQQQLFRELLLSTRKELADLYKNESLSADQKRSLKAEAIERLRNKYNSEKVSWFKPSSYDYWFEKPINNARLSATMAYLEKVPAFFAVFLDSDANWEEFYNEVRALGKLDTVERKKRVDALIFRNVTLRDIRDRATGGAKNANKR